MEIIYHHFETITSTNDWVKSHLKNLPEGSLLLVSADAQSAARGQYGRSWLSPERENIYATFGFYVKTPCHALELTHLLGISAAKMLRDYGVSCHLKWPNDLLVNGKKIAGILCETENFGDCLGITLGIGLNVNMSEKILGGIGQPATSMCVETGRDYDVKEVLGRLKDYFVEDLGIFLAEGFGVFERDFRTLSGA